MTPLESIVYVLCTLTSGLCAWLLVRAYRRVPVSMLYWSGLCFMLLTLNNLMVFTDIVVLPSWDLTILRFLLSLAAVSVLIFGFVWGL